MEFLFSAIVAFIVFIAAVISGMKEVEKKQTSPFCPPCLKKKYFLGVKKGVNLVTA